MSVDTRAQSERNEMATPGERQTGRPSRINPTLFFWLVFASLTLLSVAFSLTSPLAAGPDETAHMTRGVSLVHGQFIGTIPEGTTGETVVTVPRGYYLNPACFAFKPEQSAGCYDESPAGGTEPQDVVTTAGLYNPFYYALVSWPSLFADPPLSIYLMRFVSAAACSLLLAAGLRLLLDVNRGGFAFMGVAAAISPMVVFLNGVVNPNSLEIAASLTCAAGAFVILRHPDRKLLPMRLLVTSLSAAALVLTRGLSPLFLAIIIVIALIAARPGALRAAFSWRGTWLWAAFVFLSTLAATAWTFATNSLMIGAGDAHQESLRAIIEYTLGQTSHYWESMIGVFGWLDTTMPGWVIMTWSIVVGVCVLFALAVGAWRDRIAIILTGAAVFAFPIAAQITQWAAIGPFWQGRYVLPVGIPMLILSGLVTSDRASTDVRRLGRQLTPWLCLAVGICFVTACVVNLHRYVAGVNGWWLAVPPGAWLPPIPILVVLAAFILGTAGYLLLLWWGSTHMQRATLIDEADGRRLAETPELSPEPGVTASAPTAVPLAIAIRGIPRRGRRPAPRPLPSCRQLLMRNLTA